MTAIPEALHTLPAEIYRWRERNADDGLRPHLGASLAGHPCSRHLWLTFRWAARAHWDGRMLRLFERGQREEAVLVQELRGIGAEVSECDNQGGQWRVEFCGGHAGGSLDGGVRRIPGGSKDKWEVLEFKTHNARSFKELSEKGVEKSKFMHWCQMQIYMALTGMDRANYIAVCKDDDRIYHERVHYDADVAKTILERIQSLVFMDEPPARLSDDPEHFQCRGCQHFGLCHGTQAPLPTCRSCAHVTPLKDGTWRCERHDATLTVEQQKAACQAHRFIPKMLLHFAALKDADAGENWVRYTLHAGGEFVNGQPPEGVTSDEIHACHDKAALGLVGSDAQMDAFRSFSMPASSAEVRA